MWPRIDTRRRVTVCAMRRWVLPWKREPRDSFGPSDSLYHYTMRDAALGFILPTGWIRLGLLRYMNDPREAKKWYILPAREVDAPGCPQSEDELLAFSDAAPAAENATPLGRGYLVVAVQNMSHGARGQCCSRLGAT